MKKLIVFLFVAAVLCAQIDTGGTGGGGGSGTVTSFSSGDLSPLFTTSEATATTTPALTFSLSTAAAHTFFGNNTGSTAAPGFQAIAEGDVTSLTSDLALKSPLASPTFTGTVTLPASTSLTTPVLGVATATSINKMAITAPATSSTLAVADGKTLTASNSLTLAGTDSTTMTFPSVSATITRTVASGAKALATSAIGSAACSSAQTDTATGAATTDTVAATFNGDPTAVTGFVPLTTGMLTIIVYPTTNTVNFKVCNNTSASITPGAITLNWRVTR